MRYAKAVTIVVLVASAVAALGVAPASAAKFKTSVKSAALDGTQEGAHVMEIEGNKVSCSTAEFTGTSSPTGESETQEVAPVYNGCTAFGLSTVTIKTTGCRFLLNANTNLLDLKSCTAGAGGMTILATSSFTTCEVEIKNQVQINGVSYANMNPRTQFTVQLNSTNIDWKILQDSFWCPLPAVGTEGANGKYTGLSGVKANGGAAEIWLE
jgi:hypothetical protein